MTPLRTASLRKLSPKREAERRLAEGRPAWSTIAPKPKSKSATQKNAKPRKLIAKVGKQKAKRQARNKAYYASAEWKAKKAAVHERDGFQCTEIRLDLRSFAWWLSPAERMALRPRCPNRGEIVNGKQTARGLVAEEQGYQHRGIAGAIGRIKTRCKDCDRRLTPLERINHAHGFNNRSPSSSPR